MTYCTRVHEIFKTTKMLKTKQFQSNIALTTKLEKREKIKKNTFFTNTAQIVSLKQMFEIAKIERKAPNLNVLRFKSVKEYF